MRHLLIAGTILIFLFSCNKPYESTPNGAGLRDRCYAFDPALISTWMPYELNTTYYYVDSNGMKYTMTVDSEDYSEEYWATNMSCAITGDLYALANTADTLDIYMNVSYGLYASDPGGPHLTINWMGAAVYFDYSGYAADTLRPKQPTINNSLSVKEKMSFGGKDYNTVHELTVKDNRLQKLYIVKGHGIVAFTTVDNTTYWLIE